MHPITFYEIYEILDGLSSSYLRKLHNKQIFLLIYVWFQLVQFIFINAGAGQMEMQGLSSDEFNFQIFLISQIIDLTHFDFLHFLIFNRKFYSEQLVAHYFFIVDAFHLQFSNNYSLKDYLFVHIDYKLSELDVFVTIETITLENNFLISNYYNLFNN